MELLITFNSFIKKIMKGACDKFNNKRISDKLNSNQQSQPAWHC